MVKQPEYVRIQLKSTDSLRHAIQIIDAGTTQIALVVDDASRLIGTITDGDIRRGILQGMNLDDDVTPIMNTNPITANAGADRDRILALMTSRVVKQVPLIDSGRFVVGLVLLNDLLGSSKLKESLAVILAGGRGARLRPLTNAIPKPLLEVGGKPVLELIVEQLRASGFHRLFISVNHLADRVEEYFGNGSSHDVTIEYLREPEPFGTVGPLSMLPALPEAPCLLVNGDLVTKVNFDRVLDFHSEGGYDLTLGVKAYPFQIPYGVVTTDGDRVLEFQEKPTEIRLVNSGVYVLEPSVVNMVPQRYYDMNMLIDRVIAHDGMKVGAFPIHEYWMDIGTSSDYTQAKTDFPIHFGADE